VPRLGDEAPFIGRRPRWADGGRYLEVSDAESSHVVVITGDAGHRQDPAGTEFGRYAETTDERLRAFGSAAAAYGDGRSARWFRLVRQACGVEPDDTRADVADRIRRTVERLRGHADGADLQSALEPLWSWWRRSRARHGPAG